MQQRSFVMVARPSTHRVRRLSVERLETRLAMCSGPLTMQPAVQLTGNEQSMLELINRARANPAAEASRLGIGLNDGLPAGTLGTQARQPLAPSSILGAVATAHTQDMLVRRYFGHVNPDGKGPGDRTDAAGYYTTYVGENLSAKGLVAIGDAAQVLHESLFRSASHRVNTLLDGYREAGLGLKYGSIKFTNGQVQDGSIVTQNFGGGYPGKVYVTGVAYDDTIDNNRYDVGEGRSGIIVEARDARGARVGTTTGASGGYSLRLDSGEYRLLAFTADRSRMIDLGTVELTSVNVKIDVAVESLAAGAIVTETIELSGSGETLLLSDPAVNLIDVCTIDIRGSGPNRLQVDATRLREFPAGPVLLVLANQDDEVLFDAGWSLSSMRVEPEGLVRRYQNGDSRFDLIGPSDFTNPIDAFDVNANGSVSATDALVIINELASRRYSIEGAGTVRSVNSVDLDQMKFFDVSVDGRVTSLDALRVINEMGRQSNRSADGESPPERDSLLPDLQPVGPFNGSLANPMPASPIPLSPVPLPTMQWSSVVTPAPAGRGPQIDRSVSAIDGFGIGRELIAPETGRLARESGVDGNWAVTPDSRGGGGPLLNDEVLERTGCWLDAELREQIGGPAGWTTG